MVLLVWDGGREFVLGTQERSVFPPKRNGCNEILGNNGWAGILVAAPAGEPGLSFLSHILGGLKGNCCSQCIVCSAALKEQGNKAFREGDFALAIQRYSEGLEKLRDKQELYTNRAQVSGTAAATSAWFLGNKTPKHPSLGCGEPLLLQNNWGKIVPILSFI